MDEFSTRLRELLDYLRITPVGLAEKMGVQRTSFNHLLSGRNKPGFEFLTRLQACYPEVNLNWLISGQGEITNTHGSLISHTENYEPETHMEVDLFSNIFANIHKDHPGPEAAEPTVLNDHETPDSPSIPNESQQETEIARLIIVYRNGKMVEIKH